jgi:hypothetical protein
MSKNKIIKFNPCKINPDKIRNLIPCKKIKNDIPSLIIPMMQLVYPDDNQINDGNNDNNNNSSDGGLLGTEFSLTVINNTNSNDPFIVFKKDPNQNN